jgi:hypothetical protein
VIASSNIENIDQAIESSIISNRINLPPLPLRPNAIATLNLPAPLPPAIINPVPPPAPIVRRPITVKPKPTPVIVGAVLNVANQIEGATQSITITIDGHGEPNFREIVQRSEFLANDAVTQAFSQNTQITNISIAIFAERFGQLVPILSADLARRQWLTNPQVEAWARYALKSEVLLGYAPPQTAVTIPPVTQHINTIVAPRVRSRPVSRSNNPPSNRTITQPQPSNIPNNIPASAQVKINNDRPLEEDPGFRDD